MIDLHVHTTMSDGTLSPAEVVRYASRQGLKAIAVTDHDTVAGVLPAQREGDRLGIEVVAGVEISSHWAHGILHVLGYFILLDDPDLLTCLEFLKKGRLDRVPRIIARLEDCDVHISLDDVNQVAAGGVPGRPHVATVLVQKGHAKKLQDAFDRYLKKGRHGYVEKVKLQPAEAIKVISRAGGVPVLAHPYSLNEEQFHRMEKILAELMEYGLKGIEAYHPKHTEKQTQAYLELAEKLRLVVTGGTDFHGTNKPEVELGVFPASEPLPYTLLAKLKDSRLKGQPAL